MLMEFDDKKVIGSFNIAVDLTEKNIEDVIVNALEGGSNYWVGIDNSLPEWNDKPKGRVDGVPVSQWATKLVIDGKKVILYDIEDSSERWELTMEKLVKGFELNVKNRPDHSDMECFDGEDCDCILQYALFGEIVYG